MNFFATNNDLETPGSNNQEEGNGDDSYYSDANSKAPEDVDSKDHIEEFISLSSGKSIKRLQNNKKELININKIVNNNNNEQEEINEKKEKLINNENMGQGVGDLNDIFNNEDEIKEKNNPNIWKGQISDQEVKEMNVNEKCNNINNRQRTLEVKYNNNNNADEKEENMNQYEEYMDDRTRNIEAETEETTTEGLDSTTNINFIQIPNKKGGFNNSKLGLRKVCSCKCMSRN